MVRPSRNSRLSTKFVPYFILLAQVNLFGNSGNSPIKMTPTQRFKAQLANTPHMTAEELQSVQAMRHKLIEQFTKNDSKKLNAKHAKFHNQIGSSNGWIPKLEANIEGSFKQPSPLASLYFQFLEQSGAIPIILQEFYKTTAPPSTKPIYAEPSLHFIGPYTLIRKNLDNIKANWSASLFYSKTPQMGLSEDGFTLQGHVAVGDKSFARKIQDAYAAISSSPAITQPALPANINIPSILSNLTEAFVEERKIGLNASFTLDTAYSLFDVEIPVSYLERNINLLPAHRDALERMSESLFGPSTDDSYIRTYFVRDGVALGDIKLSGLVKLHKNERGSTYFGGYIVIPSATYITRYLYANKPDEEIPRHNFDLVKVFDELITKNYQSLKDFFLNQMMGRLAYNLLSQEPGQQGHLTLGLSSTSRYYLTNSTHLHLSADIALPIPGEETRLFRKDQELSSFQASLRNFDLDDNKADPALAQANLEFLQEELLAKYCPYAGTATVYPGLSVALNAKVEKSLGNFSLGLGGSFWYKGSESIHSVTSLEAESWIFDINQACRPTQWQISGTADISYKREALEIRLGGSYSPFSYGLGKNFFLNFGLSYSF